MPIFSRSSWTRRAGGGLFAAAVVGVVSSAAAGQCTPEWLQGGGVPGVGRMDINDSSVFTSMTWDADGPGGQDPVLVVGGSFVIAGDTVAKNIAVWNGSSWSALGEGLSTNVAYDIGSVRALAVYDGELIAAGEFTFSGSTPLGNIARWTGSAWAPLSAGAVKDMNNGLISALAVYDGKLVAGGSFTQVASASDNFKRIAQWNGSAWSAVSSTAVNGINNGQVNALAVYNGKLVAGGDFTQVDATGDNYSCIAQWDGSGWTAVDSNTFGLAGLVLSLAVYNGNLVAGGLFFQFDFLGNANIGIAQWDGTAWSGVSPIAAGSRGIDDGLVVAMTTHDNKLYIGGTFTQIDGTKAYSNFAQWDGSAWTAQSEYVEEGVIHLGSYNGRLIAGGSFRDVRPSTHRVQSIASWDGAAWHGLFDPSITTDAAVNAMSRFSDGRVGAGGEFTLIEGISTTFAATVGDEFATASAIGTGLFESPYVDPPTALVTGVHSIVQMPAGGPLAGTVFAGGGEFAATSGGFPYLIAQSTGAAWSPLATPLVTFEIMPNSFLGSVNAMLALPNGDVLVGGQFFFPGDPNQCQVARWNGTAWTALMAEPLVDADVVYTMAYHSGTGEVYIGGSFGGIGLVAGTKNVARWDGLSTNGDGTAQWQPLGKGADDAVYALRSVASDTVMVGGAMWRVGNATPNDTFVNSIAAWNTTTGAWSALNLGVANGRVYAIEPLSGGRVAVGGEFLEVGNAAAGDLAASNIAAWDTSTHQWSALGDGVSGTVRSLATTADGTLLVGGEFDSAGGLVSARLARWGCTAAVCAADFNGVNGVTVQDIFDFLTAWLAGSPLANFNGINGVTVQDIFDFLTAWLAGC